MKAAEVGLQTGFAVPISTRHRGKWGVMSFYNTWSVASAKASLYREETLQFCRSTSELVAAKIDLEARLSSGD